SIRAQWLESGIERVFIRRENFVDFLAWAMKKSLPEGHPNIQLVYLQERLYPVDRNLLVDGLEPQFSLYAFHDGQLMPVMFPDAPNLPTRVDQRYLRQFSQIYIHLRDLGLFLEYLHKQWGAGATKIPMNKRGAVIVREKMRMAALSVFCSTKVGDAIGRARRTVDDIIHMITGNPDTFHSMLAVSDLDANTYIHSANVMVMSVGLGVAMGWSKEQLHILGLGALLHDIGKREIPRELLLKKGAISSQEYEALKEHVLLGIQFCRLHPEIPDQVTRIVAEHHEKLDGSGYPRGITGRAIWEPSQVVAIMEVYDALTTHQPFRKAMLPAYAFRKLRSYEKTYNQEFVEKFFQQVGPTLPR
ncbi:MAG: HD domain-containing protein, partial [Magnetococcales bacterium]|nr:HD domain-containing protein [Magnetococcales bacterium]